MTLETISYITLFFILTGMVGTLGYCAYLAQRPDKQKAK